MNAVDRLIDLQAAANTQGWTIRALEIPMATAEQLAAELNYTPSTKPLALGEFGQVDGIVLTIVPDWKPT